MINIIQQSNLVNEPIQLAKPNVIKKSESIELQEAINDDIKPLKVDINDVCSLKEVKFDSTANIKQEEVISTTKSLDKDSFDINEIGIQIIANSSSEYKNNAKKVIKYLKDLADTSQEFMYFGSTFKLVTASKNGIILFFNDELDADLLNKNFTNVEIQKAIIKIVSQPMYIISGSKSQILKMKKVALTTQDLKLKSEPNLDKIRQKLKESHELGTIAYEIFGPTTKD